MFYSSNDSHSCKLSYSGDIISNRIWNVARLPENHKSSIRVKVSWTIFQDIHLSEHRLMIQRGYVSSCAKLLLNWGWNKELEKDCFEEQVIR